MRESKLPIPHPSHPRFPEAIHRINRHTDALAAGSTPEGSSDPVAGFSPALSQRKTFVYVIDEHIEGGRYRAHPVSHQLSDQPEPPPSPGDPIPPRDPDIWSDATWLLGPECDGVVFPLVELNALETVEEGTRVKAWLSPAGDCMQFAAGGGGAGDNSIWVKITGSELTGGDAGYWPFKQSFPQPNTAWADDEPGAIEGHFFPVPPMVPVVGRYYRAWFVGTREDDEEETQQVYVGGWNGPDDLDYAFVCGYDEIGEVATLSLEISLGEDVIKTVEVPVICQDAITDVNCGEDGSVVATTEKRMYIDCSCLPPE